MRISDTGVTKATGRTYAQWFALLDARGCKKLDHTTIAKLVFDEFETSGWWSQMITVEYERARGLRVVNQKCSGDFSVSKSKTIPVPLARLYRAVADAKTRARWLADAITV